MNCEICDKEITNTWGYLSDFDPNYPPRDRSNDQELWGIQAMTPTGKSEFHYYCSKNHAEEGERKLGYKIVGEIANAQ